ncbi:MAG TPA: TMEM165/GDT1 family protein [Desulfobacteraceae bacterium]|nr:TMEM165/GDT1 family protein [Desulfobacteraceae bacterium]HPJ67837.1 TMEM165/GDT1 family protein [Desulfobacteraceae bacterium]HPQ28162.1 TMEM165/GDT1 family protein [Desulfobacteraceae bacterium]
MEMRLFLTVFTTVFLAELGDKTQLATILYAADKEVSKLVVFIAASAALVVTSAIGVAAGGVISQIINPRYLSIAAGIGFILIGIFTVIKA